MSTGLTFGTISALFGLNAGIIDVRQFALLVTVVVLGRPSLVMKGSNVGGASACMCAPGG